MGGGRGTMRAGPARRDPDFRGIDTDALGNLIRQVKDATTAIKGWLDAHPLPPEVPRTGVRMATEVDLWASSQLGMLTRRRNYALTHPDRVHEMPRPGPPALAAGAGAGAGRRAGANGSGGGAGAPRAVPSRAAGGGHAPRRTTPSGAGPELGNFPTQQAAAKAAATDVLALTRAGAADAAPPDAVWRHLRANADDPDYTAALYRRLGPAGTAALIAAAHGDRSRLGLISASLGTASRHLPIDEKWLRALLADVGPAHRAEAVRLLHDAHLGDQVEAALRGLGDPEAAPSPHPGTARAAPAGHGPPAGHADPARHADPAGHADECRPRGR
jgi:hypothetical protein